MNEIDLFFIAVILGREFTERDLSNQEYVEVLYKTFFNQEGDTEGLTYWIESLENGKARSVVLSGFVNSKEFSALCATYGIERGVMLGNGGVVNIGIVKYVKRCYLTILGRECDNGGLNSWVTQLKRGRTTAGTVAFQFFNSNEYISKNKNNEEYVMDLYHVFFDREPDAGGIQYWISQLKKGESRNVVLRKISYANEFKNILADYGLQY